MESELDFGPCDEISPLIKPRRKRTKRRLSLTTNWRDNPNVWTCAFCDVEFSTRCEFEEHRLSTKHLQTEKELDARDVCFHQNYLDCEQCSTCNPHLNMNSENFRQWIHADCKVSHENWESIYHCNKCSPTWPYCPLCEK